MLIAVLKNKFVVLFITLFSAHFRSQSVLIASLQTDVFAHCYALVVVHAAVGLGMITCHLFCRTTW